jgi:hypothetical protein
MSLPFHRHDNSGPKFGIQLLGPNVRATNTLHATGKIVTSVDLLHVPTPWHGCVVEVLGHDQLYMTKSQVVRAAIASGEFEGDLEVCDSRGAYFRLRPARPEESKAVGLGVQMFTEEDPLVGKRVDATSDETTELTEDGDRSCSPRTYPGWSPAVCSEAETVVDSKRDAKEADYTQGKVNGDSSHLLPANMGPGWSPAMYSEAETCVDSIGKAQKEVAQYNSDRLDHHLEPFAPDTLQPGEAHPSVAKRAFRRIRALITGCFGLQCGAHRKYPEGDHGQFY